MTNVTVEMVKDVLNNLAEDAPYETPMGSSYYEQDGSWAMIVPGGSYTRLSCSVGFSTYLEEVLGRPADMTPGGGVINVWRIAP